MNKKIQIGIVDDHQLIIDGLMALLKDHPSIQIVFATTDPSLVLSLLKENEIDLLITDVMMPQMSGQQLAKKVRESYPAIKILALSMSGEAMIVQEMIEDADIAGYALKNISKLELINGIHKIIDGGIFFSEEVIEEMKNAGEQAKRIEAAHLTIREIEIIRLIEKEYNNDEIANLLFISKRTVETHRKNIFRKTNTNSILSLVKYAYENKLIN